MTIIQTMAQFVIVGILLCCSHLALTVAQDTNGTSSGGGLIQEFSLKESQVDHILVWWNISEEFDLKELIIIHKKKEGEFTTYSTPQYNYTQEFLITDLISKTSYNICLSIKLEDASKCLDGTIRCQKCLDLSTIPMIRDDSLIAVIAVLGIIFLLILIGCFCWHYAKKKAQEEDEETESIIGSDESKQPILLQVPPTSNGPRRSVDFEDQDIPYITPPIEDVKREQNYTSSGGTVV